MLPPKILQQWDRFFGACAPIELFSLYQRGKFPSGVAYEDTSRVFSISVTRARRYEERDAAKILP